MIDPIPVDVDEPVGVRSLSGGERRVSLATLSVVRRAAKAKPADDEADPGEAEPDADPDDAGPPLKIVGHASVFNRWATLVDDRHFRWREVIRPGAFKNAIKERQDVRALFNHDPNFVLGRTKSGTLVLSEDARGLLSETIPPDTQTVRDLVIAPMERGDVDGMSFAFSIRRAATVTITERDDGSVVTDSGGERITQRFEGDRLIEDREVLDADLYDVSPVTYPAYDGTSVALRATGSDIERRARAEDRPHRRPAPRREQYRRRLDEAATTPPKVGT